MLPEFDGDASTTPESAKQDKLDVELGSWVIRGNDDVANHLLRELASMPVPLDRTRQRIRTRQRRTWFTQPQGWTFGSLKIQFRGGGPGGRALAGSPMISGYLRARPRGERPDDGPTHFEITATLSINPTRFVRHRGAKFPTHEPPEDWATGTDPWLLLSGRYQARNRDEITLDGSDNVLLTQRSIYASRPEVWTHQLECFWRNVQTFLDDRIAVAAELQGIACRRDRVEVNLRKAETYWEFRTENALRAVSALIPTMQALGRETAVRDWPIAEEGFTGNARSVTIRLITGITCTFYAKTNRRVRMEIKHDLTRNTAPLDGGHTSTDPNDLLNWLHRLAEDATVRGEQILRRLTHAMDNDVPQRSVYELLTEIRRAVGTEEDFEYVVTLLAENQRIEVPPNDPFRPAVVRLVDRGVLERALRYSRVYMVHPQYRAALSQLRP